MKRKNILMLALGIIICFLSSGVVGMTVNANEEAFNIDAEMLPPSKATYDIKLTVENTGEDWEGIVRLKVRGGFYGTYDTVISLAQNSAKQFVVRVPKESVCSTKEGIQITLLDKDLNVTAEKVFNQLLSKESLAVGILSDAYSELTFLDMGGMEIDFYSNKYPIRLMELNKDNLSNLLYSLTFLVIDSYNTGILSDDEISDIEKWVDNGGVLIIGTGSYAEDTLRGFGYLGVECGQVHPPDEDTYFYDSGYVHWSLLNMADLVYPKSQYYFEEYSSLVVAKKQGDGAVGILPYALTELGGLDDESAYRNYTYFMDVQSEFVQKIFEDTGAYANARYETYSYMAESAAMFRDRFGSFGNGGDSLNFGVMQFIIIIYLIFAGPVLYLILRYVKKRELYWAAVPVSALVGVLLVFLAGRTSKVENTRVYSVTVYDFVKRRDCTTYLHCYNAGHEEWALRLAEGYEYVGPQAYIQYDYSQYDDSYYHRIRKDGDRLYFGIKPSLSFEDSYFCAGRAMGEQDVDGDVILWAAVPNNSQWTSNNIKLVPTGFTNRTNYDLLYFAIVEYNSIKVYKALPAGKTSELTDDELLFKASLGGYYNYLFEADKCVEREDWDAIAALYIGINAAYRQMDSNSIAAVGVVENWYKVVDDNCNEVSYGCLCSIR